MMLGPHLPASSVSPNQPAPDRSSRGVFRGLYEKEAAAADLGSAARQFEALILAQILKAAQSSAQLSTLDGEQDQASATMLDLAQEGFAQAIAGQGGMGISGMIRESLARETANLPRRD